MRNVAIRQIQSDFSSVPARVVQGEEVTVFNPPHPVTRICPPLPEASGHVKMSGFAARAETIFGDKMILNVV